MNDCKLSIIPENDILVEIKQENISLGILPEPDILVEMKEVIEIDGIQEHNKLLNLDFEHSGHTGFASSQELSILENKVNTNTENISIIQQNIQVIQQDYLKKDLSILSNIDLTQNRSAMSIYIDNNGTYGKASLIEVLDKKIRTNEIIPSDLQAGDYLFKIEN